MADITAAIAKLAAMIAEARAATFERDARLAEMDHDTRTERARLWDQHEASIKSIRAEHDRLVALLAAALPPPRVLIPR